MAVTEPEGLCPESELRIGDVVAVHLEHSLHCLDSSLSRLFPNMAHRGRMNADHVLYAQCRRFAAEYFIGVRTHAMGVNSIRGALMAWREDVAK